MQRSKIDSRNQPRLWSCKSHVRSITKHKFLLYISLPTYMGLRIWTCSVKLSFVSWPGPSFDPSTLKLYFRKSIINALWSVGEKWEENAKNAVIKGEKKLNESKNNDITFLSLSLSKEICWGGSCYYGNASDHPKSSCFSMKIYSRKLFLMPGLGISTLWSINTDVRVFCL